MADIRLAEESLTGGGCEKACNEMELAKKENENTNKMERRSNGRFAAFVLVCCFFAQSLSLGFFVSFGTIYVELIKIFNTTETTAAWIGSIAMSVCFAVGSITSFFIKKYGCGTIISLGGLLLGLGLLLSSLATDITALALTFSGLMSVGCSFLFFASLSALPMYFKSGLCIATSAVCSGSNFSGITFSPLMAFLIKNYGFKMCFQMFSATALIPIIGGLIMQKYGTENVGESEKVANDENKLSYRSLLTNKRLLVVFAAMSLIELCYFIPYVHLVNFGIHQGIPLIKASWLPVTLSIGGWVGKIVFGIIGQVRYFNKIYLFQIFLLAMAICLTLLPLATTFTHLMTFSVIYGIFDGAFAGYIFPVVATTVPPEQVGIAFGTLYTFISVELLFGAPLAGFIYSQTSSYQVPFLLCGGILLIAALIFFALPAQQLVGIQINVEEKLLLEECDHIKDSPRDSIFKRLLVKLKTDSLLRNMSPLSRKILNAFDLLPTEDRNVDTVINKNQPTNKNQRNETRDSESTSLSLDCDDISMNSGESISTIDTSFDENNNCTDQNKASYKLSTKCSYKTKQPLKSTTRTLLEAEKMTTNDNADVSSRRSTVVELCQSSERRVAVSGIQQHNKLYELANNLYSLRVFIDGYLNVIRRAMLPQRYFSETSMQYVSTMC